MLSDDVHEQLALLGCAFENQRFGMFFLVDFRKSVFRTAVTYVLMSSAENENGEPPVKRMRYQYSSC